MGTLYESIRSLCEEKGITVSKMCIEIGTSKAMMSDLKNGRKTGISASTAKKIADYFGVSIDTVLGNEEVDPLQILKDEEKTLLHSFRTMTDEQKRMMLVFMKGLKND